MGVLHSFSIKNIFYNKIDLRKYDTNEISLNFPELCIIGKYVKIRFKNRCCNFVPGSFFKQDHLLNLIILGGYAKR